MGTVEWSELLRWVPRDPQTHPAEETGTKNPWDGPATPTPAPAPETRVAARRVEPGKATLAVL